MKQIQETLRHIGLTEGEIKVYSALLTLGETSTGSIIKESNITGSKVYEILNKLMEKGFVSYILKNNVKYFSPADPQLILSYLEDKENQLVKVKEEVANIVPEIKNILENKKERQYATLFEGWKGVTSIFDMILSSLKRGETYRVVGLRDEFDDPKVLNFFIHYHKRRVKKGINAKVMLATKEKSKMKKYFRNIKDLELRYHDTSLPSGIFLFKDYIVNLSYMHEPVAFLMKSKRFAEYYGKFFEELWKKAKP